ncbi:general odorant-binding protein 99b-like [Armigeres subalbatus]|uniref:general odorant-binding protein 99b-like n=1 Tax=Armigeres subalbatus TaxID=124917 RepID=UPI002ED48C7E
MIAVRYLRFVLIIGMLLTIPVNAGEILNRLIAVCTQGQNSSAELVERYKNGDFPDDHNTHCMMRCVALNFGVYDDLNGIHMHDTWLMFRAGRSAAQEKSFADQHHKCIAQQTKAFPSDDYCGRVFAIYQCYKEEFQTMLKNIRKGAAKAARH